MSFRDEVYEAVKSIPRGKVATYGLIALLVGRPRASRAVGWALHQNPYEGIVPCHRVVNRSGRLAAAFVFGGEEVQKRLLEDEGVEVGEDFTVDMARFAWKGEAEGTEAFPFE